MTVLRQDLKVIADIVSDGSKVLDVGCCDGALLYYLATKKQVQAHGIELSQSGVSTSVKNGLSVIQGDADSDLKFYPDKCFDYVISSQMLQATHNPKEVLDEMLRIGNQVIVSIPNFGYWQNRYYLLAKGRMPVTESLSYEWYETPNIHFCTIRDFSLLVKQLKANTKKIVYLTEQGQSVSWLWRTLLPNFFSSSAVFVLSK